MRRGITLVETLVAIGLLGLLAALLLPAVSGAREAQRRVVCAAKLRELALAAANYEAAHGWLVGANITGRWQTVNSSSHQSAHSKLLAYLGHEDLGRELLVHDLPPYVNIFDVLGTDAAIPEFLCPSDGWVDRGTNYVACHGRGFMFVNEQTKAGDVWNVDNQGFFDARLRRPAELRRGRSRIAFMSERVQGDGADAWLDPVRDILPSLGNPRDYYVRGSATSPLEASCRDAQEKAGEWARHFSLAGHAWSISGPATTSYNHGMTPNSAVADCGDFVFSGFAFETNGAKSARSFHPGVVNVAFADGHAEAIGDHVNARAWAAMSMVRDGFEPF